MLGLAVGVLYMRNNINIGMKTAHAAHSSPLGGKGLLGLTYELFSLDVGPHFELVLPVGLATLHQLHFNTHGTGSYRSQMCVCLGGGGC